MNDNLRYISLQYIKGNNYDKVTCFSFNNEQFKNFLDTNKDANEKDLFYSLEETKKSKCEIGESLLDDLINYIEFKELIPLLEKRTSHVLIVTYHINTHLCLGDGGALFEFVC